MYICSWLLRNQFDIEQENVKKGHSFFANYISNHKVIIIFSLQVTQSNWSQYFKISYFSLKQKIFNSNKRELYYPISISIRELGKFNSLKTTETFSEFVRSSRHVVQIGMCKYFHVIFPHNISIPTEPAHLTENETNLQLLS